MKEHKFWLFEYLGMQYRLDEPSQNYKECVFLVTCVRDETRFIQAHVDEMGSDVLERGTFEKFRGIEARDRAAGSLLAFVVDAGLPWDQESAVFKLPGSEFKEPEQAGNPDECRACNGLASNFGCTPEEASSDCYVHGLEPEFRGERDPEPVRVVGDDLPE